MKEKVTLGLTGAMVTKDPYCRPDYGGIKGFSVVVVAVRERLFSFLGEKLVSSICGFLSFGVR